jgi:putative hemolysin
MKIPRMGIILIILTAVSLLFLSGCSLFRGRATPTPYPEDGEEDPFIGMPNPASFYCQEMGYNLELRETDQGTEGICIFPNGAECEEWEFLAGF